MIVRLMTKGNALALKLLQPLTVDLNAVGSRDRCVRSFASGKSFTSFAMSCVCFWVGGRSSGMISTRSRVAMYFR